MKPWRVGVLVCLAAALATRPSLAQDYSYDGNRWYEVEVLVFRHLGMNALVSEVPAPPLQMPSPPVAQDGLPRELASPLDPFLIDFAQLQAELDATSAPASPPVGPERLPHATGGFRLMDFARDGWIALPAGLWSLARDHERLQDSPAHEPLWHEAWRQPLAGPAQAEAVAVRAEDADTGQTLAGSVRLLPFNGSTVRIEVDLELGSENERWILQDRRDLLPNTFHYFDNPAFGVLLRVRPYVLPPRELTESATDF